MKHLFIQTAFLGDLLLSIPSLKRIRRWDPHSHITLLCRKGLGDVIRHLRLCDEVIEVNKKDKESLLELDKKLKTLDVDYIFCPHQSMRSHSYVKAVKAKYKVGYKKLWNGSYFTHRIKRNLDRPEALRQLELIAVFDSDLKNKMSLMSSFSYDEKIQLPEWARMSVHSLAWSDEDYKLVEKKFLGQFDFKAPYICIAPGSVWPTKRWVEEGFVKSATDLARQGYQVVILGAPDERGLCEKIQRQIPKSLSMAGNLSIWESMMVLSRSKTLICNDSGAMHMAAVVDVPIVSVFGPTVQELGYRPWSSQSSVLENKDLLCRPCGQHGGRYCPIGTHDCMKSVSPKRVVESVLSNL